MRRSAKELNKQAAKLGLIITRYSPGDKVTYKLMKKDTLTLLDFSARSLSQVEAYLGIYATISSMAKNIAEDVDKRIVGEITKQGEK
jgi:hypothetical protein